MIMRSLTLKFIGAVLAALVVSAFGAVVGQTYTTIADGDWDDPLVWSTNAVDPCFCTPSASPDGEDIDIMHAITLDEDLRMEGGSTLTIGESGSLLMPDHELYMEDCMLLMYGFMHVGSMDIEDDSYVLIESSCIVEGELYVEHSTFEVMFDVYDTLKVMSGDINIDQGVTLTVENACLTLYEGEFYNEGSVNFDNASLCTVDGDMYNEGVMSFSGNTCATGTGDFYNEGEVSGTGAVTMTGMIDNQDGDWSGVDYCGSMAMGSMPMAMSCSTTDSICALTGQDIPLDIEGMELSLRVVGDAVDVTWITTALYDVRMFYVERAGDDFVFDEVGIVAPYEGLSGNAMYQFVDRQPLSGTSFYRISTEDYDGLIEYSEIRHISLDGSTTADMRLYPNPVNECRVSVVLFGFEDRTSGTLSVYDPAGRQIETHEINVYPGDVTALELGDIIPGPYVVQFSNEELNLSEVLIVVGDGI